MPIDQPPLTPQVSEVRYAEEQKKAQQRRDEERKKNLDAEMRRRSTETKQKK
ncbi:hypothetical protein [Rhodococcus opacus]|uniref:hypothetical protein n=1 Tax=Rhodococcus opacus TaxID=37919 RepID=UPI002948C9E0|nr:hypothetical protein [Rhodococcus opacus]MDV6244775.1 hypothetical protein [Rhodococcus opacus]